jgi:hypothetical protein
MAYPLHIQRPATIVAQGGTPSSPLQQYVDRLIRLIPAEVIAAYQAIRGIVVGVAPTSPGAQSFLPWLPIIGVILVLFVRAWGTRAPSGDPKTIQWPAVGIAMVSFVVLIISLGHPIIVQTPIATWIGSVLLILWVFLLPYIYEGS